MEGAKEQQPRIAANDFSLFRPLH